jgi:hypothetical protein
MPVRRPSFLVVPLSILAMILISTAVATAGLGRCCPKCQCPDGCRYEEVITHVCRPTEVKTPIKKIVYECKEVPYCRHATSTCSCCKECESCARYKKVLVKKEIICGEKCEIKCVPEEVRRIVAVPCHKCGYCEEGNCTEGVK